MVVTSPETIRRKKTHALDALERVRWTVEKRSIESYRPACIGKSACEDKLEESPNALTIRTFDEKINVNRIVRI